MMDADFFQESPMTAHFIRPERRSLHGKWNAALEPAVEIESGDTVVYSDLLDVAYGCGQHDVVNQRRDKWTDRESPRDDGPAMHGPVYVRDAVPGSTLAVTIERLVVGDYGWTWGGNGPFNAELNKAVGLEDGSGLLLWDLDMESMTAVSEHGLRLPIRPFFGTIGLCPEGSGWHEGWYPTRHGGNMDCPPLIEGSTIYFPVAHDGGLFSLGDTHARQGDGELSGSAIECMTREATLSFEVRTDFPVETVTAVTPSGWVTAGFDRDLDSAVRQAVSGMLDLMERLLEVDRARAMLLGSSVVDVRITQLVNGVRGVHCLLHPEVFG